MPPQLNEESVDVTLSMEEDGLRTPLASLLAVETSAAKHSDFDGVVGGEGKTRLRGPLGGSACESHEFATEEIEKEMGIGGRNDVTISVPRGEDLEGMMGHPSWDEGDRTPV